MPKAKILQEMRLHRSEDGAHEVEHHHTAHPPETYRFKRLTQAVGHMLTHGHKLESKGLPKPSIEEQDEDSAPNSWAGRPFSFDVGSTRGGRVSGREE